MLSQGKKRKTLANSHIISGKTFDNYDVQNSCQEENTASRARRKTKSRALRSFSTDTWMDFKQNELDRTKLET